MKPVLFDAGRFQIEIFRKKIKHIYFRAYPLKNKVVVSVPLSLGAKELNDALLSKNDWMIRQMEKADLTAVIPEKSFLTGDTFLFQGEMHTLTLIEQEQGKKGVFLFDERQICLKITPDSTSKQRQDLLEKFFRKALKRHILAILEKWQPLIQVRVRQFGIRKMKTRWGSCNIRAARIWLNLRLIHLNPEFIEYVAVHEMVHLIERGHNDRFKGFMDRFIPHWRSLKRQLGDLSLNGFL